MAEGVGFEPTRPCGLPVFKTGAFNRTLPPLLMVISLANRPMYHILSSLKSKKTQIIQLAIKTGSKDKKFI